jgi:hypothetical protein
MTSPVIGVAGLLLWLRLQRATRRTFVSPAEMRD